MSGVGVNLLFSRNSYKKSLGWVPWVVCKMCVILGLDIFYADKAWQLC